MGESRYDPPSVYCRLQGMLFYYSVLLDVTFFSTVTAAIMLLFADIACEIYYSSLHSLSIGSANYFSFLIIC